MPEDVAGGEEMGAPGVEDPGAGDPGFEDPGLGGMDDVGGMDEF